MNDTERESIDRNIRRAVGTNVLGRIGKIVAAEQRADMEKAKVLSWLVRYGVVVLAGAALLLSLVMGVI